ncbi:FadR/GntR family transcriptional regulator [Planctellipticum variicoloris]|uniref:FadR/GntR family transcriptional regulator n=1 Tax=Planctellipticum variicoloris TaxID=3064265 RepID=UPI003013F817|nr:FCD domain-containing protein [Planctomycetaceae bacterium SH412]
MSVATPVAKTQTDDFPRILEVIGAIVTERGLSPGDQLPSIRELADRLGLKPTTVRDALLKAESQGLVKVLPRAGVFLRAGGLTTPVLTGQPLETAPSHLLAGEPNVLHLLDARRLIEIELAGRAARHRRLEEVLPVRRALDAILQLPADASRAEDVRLDVRFHIEIARLGGNAVLCGLQQTLLEQLVPHLNEVPPSLERRGITNRSHVAIYEALVAGDVDRIRQEMREHLSLAYDSLLESLQRPPNLFASDSDTAAV